MSYDSLREAIVENIRPNGNQEITGQALQDALLGIIDEAEAADNLAAPKATTYNKTEVDNLVAGAVYPKADKSDVENLAEATNQALGGKADKGGIYKQMSVGFAQDIVGDGSATEEEFSFRPTAGEDRNVANTTYYEGERNGVSRIEKIKGNSVVYNQHFKGVNTRTQYGYRTSSEGNIVTIENGSASTPDYGNMSDIIGFSITAGHKYLALADSPLSLAINGLVGWSFSVNRISDSAPDLDYGAIYLRTTSAPSLDILPVGGSISFHLVIHDLTQMFGAGNEPTTVEEFYERLPKGVDINAYNEGQIVDGNYGAIKTVGFNAFNGIYAKVCGGCPYYLGGNYTSLGFATEEEGTIEAIAIPTSTEIVGTTPNDRLYTPSQNGYIYAEGENININLSWDTEYGYLNGTYQPYKPFERDLSWVAQYFPNGMRSAGSVRDEIRFNSTTQKWEAVQNVGSRAYISGDESNSAVTTDGTKTNYALNTPDVTEIDEIPSMDFDVSDYGTEELIVADGVQSAALVADISYSPNALSTLKQVPDILKRLKALESVVAQQTTNVEPSNIE